MTEGFEVLILIVLLLIYYIGYGFLLFIHLFTQLFYYIDHQNKSRIYQSSSNWSSLPSSASSASASHCHRRSAL
jgi:hypothetical protein